MKSGGNIFAARPMKKFISIFLLVFEAIFLNIIVPGHTRGVITLSGKTSATSVADLGCPFCSQRAKIDPKHAPNEKEQSECAICNLAVRLTLPPVIDFVPPPLCLAMAVEAPAPIPAPSLRVRFVRQDRAPPLVA
jgi:DUF2946 family protein